MAIFNSLSPGRCAAIILEYAFQIHVKNGTLGHFLLYIALRWISLDDIIEWKHFTRNWPFVWGIHWWPVNSPDKGQWCRALMFSLICTWINGWENNREASDLRRHHAHYDTVMMDPLWPGNGLVPSGNKPLPEPILTYIHITICQH